MERGESNENLETAKMLWKNPFVLNLQLRLADTDSVGHINNVAFVEFLETLRTEWHSFAKGSRLSLNNWDWILGEIQIIFKKEAYLSDELVGYLWCSRIGTKSWDFCYAICNQENQLILKAKTSQIAFDYEKKVSIPIPSEIQTDLKMRLGGSW